MKTERNTIPFSSVINNLLFIIALAIGIFSCKKDNQRVNNTNNDTYSDTAFINSIKYNLDYCGANYNIEKNVTYPATHSAASILNDYINNVQSNAILNIFQIGIENDYKVQIQDIYHTFRCYNNDIIMNLDFNVNNISQVSSNIIGDSLIFYSGNNSFKIINVEAEFIATILNKNPLSVRFDVKILKGKLIKNSSEYDLTNANIKFSDTYTFFRHVTCFSGCYDDFRNTRLVGNVILYKGQTNDTLLYEYLNDTITISIIPTNVINNILLNYVKISNFLENNIEITSDLVKCPNFGIAYLQYSSAVKMSFKNTPYIYIIPNANSNYYKNIDFNNRDSIRINIGFDGVLKTNDLSIINQNIDTSQIKTYSIQGKFVRF